MDELVETELYEAAAGLGNWHDVGDKKHYLVNNEECVQCLRDLQYALSHDEAQTGSAVRLKLGEWKVLPNHLVPLFTSYREDPEISSTVLKVLVHLTTRAKMGAVDQLRHLEHLQDYKEAFAEKDVFIILMGMIVENMEDDPGAKPKANSKEIFNGVLTLLRNLVSVPDPAPGDAGFTPMRKHLQLVYIKHFHDEGMLDFFLLFAESLLQEQDAEKQAWELADILYHICTHVNPEELTLGGKEKDKSVLKDLLVQEQVGQRVRMPPSSRHSRFGTVLQTRTKEGGTFIYTSVQQTEQVSKGSRLWRREFQDPTARNDKKRNAFHDPFFVDLEEGSVRDHNALNPYIRNNLDSAKRVGESVLEGLRKFFQEFVQTSFSTLISLLRSTLGHGAKPMTERGHDLEIDRPKMLNFLSWTLEFHRHHFSAQVSKAKKAGDVPPVMDIASVQGAIDLDMLQFTTARLRQYGKESGIHASHLVIVLRALLQQAKTIGVVMDSKDKDTRDCGEILTQNLVKDDVMGHLAWIMKFYKSSSHDPRIMSYAVEVFHRTLRLMKSLSDSRGQKLEFQVEKGRGRAVTTTEGEIASLADAGTVENLFHLLEKYKRHSASLNSMLVKLIYQIIRVQPSNIVVFFELSYFVRINRMWADPLLRDKHSSRRYQEMVQLLQYILRQFFKCAEKNKLAFVELLFRKVPERGKNALLESHTSEFAAILDNYESEDYKRLFDRLEAGESLDAMRIRQKAAMEGSLPWTDEEDAVLRERFHMYADHPLCAELLAAELPEDSHRTARLVKKRLQELGLIAGGKRAEQPGDLDGVDLDAVEPAKKKIRMDFGSAPPSPDVGNLDGEVDESMLENDLERLLDAAMDAEAKGAGATVDGDLPGLDLEEALEAMLEEEENNGSAAPATAPETAPAEATRMDTQSQEDSGGWMERELSAMLGGGASQTSAMLEEEENNGSAAPATAPETAPAEATRMDTQSQEDSGGWMERELSAMLGGGASQTSAPASQQTPRPAATFPDSQTAQSQSASQKELAEGSGGWLEAELGAMLGMGCSQASSQGAGDAAVSSTKAAPTQLDGTAPTAASGPGLLAGSEDAEEDVATRAFWEDAVQGVGNSGTGSQNQQAAPAEPEGPEGLELDLEKMMDGAEEEEQAEY